MVFNSDLESEYYQFLVNDILKLPQNSDFEPLARTMFLRDFYAVDPSDSARASDGLYFRDLFTAKFVDSTDLITLNASEWKDPCSVLEMILGIIVRMKSEFFMAYEDYIVVEYELFIRMLENLDIMPDDDFLIIHKRLDNLIMRKYEPCGKGSLFDLTATRFEDTDWRKQPMWNQMLAYVSAANPLGDLEGYW